MRDQVQIIDLNETFTVVIRQRDFQLSDAEKDQVEAIWSMEKERKGVHLFNGTILSALSYEGITKLQFGATSQQLVGCWIPYKLALASYRHPELGQKLSILPVAVSGLTISGNQVLIGERSLQMTQNPGCLELAPSGGIDPESQTADRIDIRKAILEELYQETGIDSSHVQQVRPFALIREQGVTAIEICIEIKVDPLLSDHFNPPTTEYSRLFWSPLPQAYELLKQGPNRVVPLSFVIFTSYFR